MGDKIKSTISKKYFITIFLLSGIFLLFTIYTSFLIVEDVLINQIYENSLNRLEQTTNAFDALHFSLIPSVVQLLQQQKIQQLVYSSDPFGFPLLEHLAILDNAKLSNPMIYSIAAYNSRSGFVFATDSGPIQANDYFDNQVLGLFNNARAQDLYRYFPRTVNGNNILSLLVGYHPIDRPGLKGGLLVNIDEPTLRNWFMLDNKYNSEKIIIVDANGIILSHTDPLEFGTTLEVNSPLHPSVLPEGNSGLFKQSLDGQDLLISYRRHDSMNWYFYLVQPYDSATATIHSARNTSLIIFPFFLIGIGFITWIVSKKLASPVEEIFNKTIDLHKAIGNSFVKRDHSESDDSIIYAQSILNSVESRLVALNSFYEDHSSLHQQEVFRGFLEGIFTWESFENTRITNFLINSEYVQILVIKSTAHEKVIDNQHIEVGLKRLMTSLQDTREYCVLSHGVGVLVLTSDTFKSWLERSNEIGKALEDFENSSIESRSHSFRTSWVAGLSSLATNHNKELSELYQEALLAIGYQFRGSGQSVFCYQETTQKLDSYLFPENVTIRMFKSLKSSHFEEALEFLQQALNEITLYGYDDFLFFVQNLLYRVHQELSPTGFLSLGMKIKLEEYRKNTHWYATIHDVRHLMTEIFADFIAQQKGHAKSRHKKAVDQVKTIVRTEYTNQNLCSESIAHQLSWTSNYLRRVFKDTTGQSLGDFITDVRLFHCKEALKDDSVSIKELYSQVGFCSYNSFFELFKKKTGLTPGEYKYRIQQSSNTELVMNK